MTLRSQITADVSTVFLNEDDFAEECTFLPKDGGQRTITCVVDEDTQFVDEGRGQWLVTTLSVFCSRDTSTGIARDKTAANPEGKPLIGDGFKREGTPDGALYAYTGLVQEVDENAWTVLFERKVPYSLGGNR